MDSFQHLRWDSFIFRTMLANGSTVTRLSKPHSARLILRYRFHRKQSLFSRSCFMFLAWPNNILVPSELDLAALFGWSCCSIKTWITSLIHCETLFSPALSLTRLPLCALTVLASSSHISSLLCCQRPALSSMIMTSCLFDKTRDNNRCLHPYRPLVAIISAGLSAPSDSSNNLSPSCTRVKVILLSPAAMLIWRRASLCETIRWSSTFLLSNEMETLSDCI